MLAMFGCHREANWLRLYRGWFDSLMPCSSQRRLWHVGRVRIYELRHRSLSLEYLRWCRINIVRWDFPASFVVNVGPQVSGQEHARVVYIIATNLVFIVFDCSDIESTLVARCRKHVIVVNLHRSLHKLIVHGASAEDLPSGRWGDEFR